MNAPNSAMHARLSGWMAAALLLLTGFSAPAQAPAWDWALAVGGTGNDNANSVALDGAGNLFATGIFFGSVDFDPGPGAVNLNATGMSDVFVTKSNPNGDLLWAVRMGGANLDFGWGATCDNMGNIFIAGSFSGTADFDPGPGVFNLTATTWTDIFVCKLDPSGAFLWAKSMGSTDNDDYGYGIAADAAGNVYVTGTFTGTGDFDPGPLIYSLTSAGMADIFICKLTSAGAFVWAKAVGGTGLDNSSNLVADAAGNLTLTGYFSGSADFNPSPTATHLLSAVAMFDCFVLRLDNGGNFGWAFSVGGSDDDYGTSLALDGFGNLYLLGHFFATIDCNPGGGVANLTSAGDKDVFLAKYSGLGNFLWAKSWGGTGIDEGLGVAVDFGSAPYITGRFTGTADLDPGNGTFNAVSAGWTDVYVLKLTQGGNFAWAKTAGGISDESGKTIAIDGAGRVFVAGSFVSSSIVFGTTSLSNFTSTATVFLARLASTWVGLAEINPGEAPELFPNPASSTVTLRMAPASAGTVAELIDAQGRIVFSTTVDRGQEEMQVSLAGMGSGIYTLRLVDDGGGVGVQRLVVVK